MESNQNKNNMFGKTSLFTLKTVDSVVEEQVSSKQKMMINDFDSALILANIDKTVKNKAVKINLKINALERNLQRINEEYELLRLLNLEKDEKRRTELSSFKSHLETQIKNLKDERRKFGIWYFVSGFFAEKIDYELIKANFLKLKEEVKKYDNAAISFLKSKNPDLLPFKW